MKTPTMRDDDVTIVPEICNETTSIHGGESGGSGDQAGPRVLWEEPVDKQP